MDKVALFSGRFDLIHLGHWLTILRLLDKAKTVKVIILDYKDRNWPAFMVKQMLDETIVRSGMFENIKTEINNVHFGEITKQQLDSYNGNLFVAGNIEVLKHVSSLGFPCMYLEPAFGIHASRYVYDKPE